MESVSKKDEVVVQFKKKTGKQKQLRRTKDDDEDEANAQGNSHNLEEDDSQTDETTEKIELMKELRKLRTRSHGVSAITLALGKKAAKEEEVLGMDPFKSKTGGMIDMDVLKNGNLQQTAGDDAYETGIGTQFSAETNTRDEDAEMLKYIEVQLNERKKAASSSTDKSEEGESSKFLSAEEAALLALPEYLRKSGNSKSEEMLSNQMLSGIPEVDLGIEVKIKNIEATEEAKLKILRDRMSKKELPSQFVPTNMAVNFVQHNRFNIEEPKLSVDRNNSEKRKIKEIEKPKKVVVVAVGAEPEELDLNQTKKEKKDKATDDFHFEKFKKQFRRF